MPDHINKGDVPRSGRGRDLVDYLILFTILAILAVFIVQVYALLHGSRGPIAIFNPPFGGKEEFSLLIVGVDGVKEHQRTDTIMLARINIKNKRVRLLSIPRDSRVDIPGCGKDKINAAFARGGIFLTRQTLEGILGFPADYYMTLNFDGFKSFVDAIGGVDIVVDKRMRYRDRSQNLNINLYPGPQHLNGEQAMGYVRYRHDIMGDITRVGRQQKFIKAVCERFLSAYNLARFPSLMEQLKSNIETDITSRDIIALARIMKKSEQVSFKSATLPGRPANIGGISYWELDPEEVYTAVNNLFFAIPEGESGETSANGNSTRIVNVLNGCGIIGIAGQAAGQLTSKGYSIGKTGNADSFNYHSSRVKVSRSFSGEGRKICDLLRIREMQVDKENEGITVIIGSDYNP